MIRVFMSVPSLLPKPYIVNEKDRDIGCLPKAVDDGYLTDGRRLTTQLLDP